MVVRINRRVIGVCVKKRVKGVGTGQRWVCKEDCDMCAKKEEGGGCMKRRVVWCVNRVR